MSEEQRYDEEPWDDLPLPDVNNAWEKMEALLDEDERRRRVLPWWFWRTAAVGLLFAGLLATGWLWLRPVAEEEKTRFAKKEGSPTNDSQKREVSVSVDKKTTAKPNTVVQPSATPGENEVANLPTPPHTTPTSHKQVSPRAEKEQQTTGIVPAQEKRPTHHKKKEQKPVQNGLPSLPPAKKRDRDKDGAVAVVKKKDAVPVLNTGAERKDSVPQPALPGKDSKAAKDSAKAAPPVAQAGEKKKSSKAHPPFVFSAGIGFQQAVALHNAPPSVPDSGGRKRPFFDYYPSVYLKLQRGRWAVQVEAQYSVPQPVGNLAFSQKTTVDAASMTSGTERQTVQKLYYHQLPVSINYHLLPQWSVGVGGVYNILAGAVTQKEVVSKYLPTGTETVSKSSLPVKGYKDSFLYKTTAGLMVQTDYYWKRFSLGVRYTQNLQPFIKYTKPNGDVADTKNNAMQAVLRFRLWKKQ